jgi:small subunit ribosomal protein S17
MPTTRLVPSAYRQFNAVVVSAGLMQKTVKARMGVQAWNGLIRKVNNSPP